MYVIVFRMHVSAPRLVLLGCLCVQSCLSAEEGRGHAEAGEVAASHTHLLTRGKRGECSGLILLVYIFGSLKKAHFADGY